MAIAIDNASVFPNVDTNSYSGTFAVSGTDRALYVAAAFDSNASISIPVVTYNAVSMTAIGNTATLGRSLYLFRLIAPDTGSNTLVVDWDGAFTAGTVELYAISLTGVDQTTPNRTLVTTGNAGSANASISGITSDANDLALSFIYINNLNITGVSDDGAQTRQGADGTNGAAILSSKSGASPSASLSYTHASQSWGAIGLSVIPSAVGPSYSITDIDGDNNVQAGQNGAVITTVGIDPASVTQTVTLGGEALTITSWS